MRIQVTDNDTAFARAAADQVATAVTAAATTIALCSGKTPVGMYGELVRRVRAGDLDLPSLTIFDIDELYGVPRTHPATNDSYLRQNLAGGVSPASFHLFDSEATDAAAECARISALIDDSGGLDLVVLGIGKNGHIAFNEPGSAFDSSARLVELERSSRDSYAPQFGSLDATPPRGLTLGIADLLAARRILLLANGASKAGVVAAALEGPQTTDMPASALQSHPDLTVVLDRGAAAELRGKY
jgi:glucosamine-6-phosphate deaminase